MFSRKPYIYIKNIEKLEFYSNLRPELEEMLIESMNKNEGEKSSRNADSTDSTIVETPSKFSRFLDLIAKLVSVFSALAILIFIVLIWMGITTFATVNITNLLTVVSFTLAGGIISIGGVRLFTFQANLRKMQNVVQKKSGCPFVTLQLSSYMLNNGEYAPGNPHFCIKCPLGIDIASNRPDGLIHNCKLYHDYHVEWSNRN